MAKINSYDDAGSPQLTDRLIGTEVNADPENATKNFTIQQLLSLLAGGSEGAVLNLPSFVSNDEAAAAGLVRGQLWMYVLPGGAFVCIQQ